MTVDKVDKERPGKEASRRWVRAVWDPGASDLEVAAIKRREKKVGLQRTSWPRGVFLILE